MKHVRLARARAGATTWVAILVIMLIFACFLVIPVVQTRRKIKRFAADIKQCAHFAAISAALELHANDCDGYPPSDANDLSGVPYCGAMKLAEAIMGQNLFGFHPESVFRADGLDAAGSLDLYPDNVDALRQDGLDANLRVRRGPYLLPENANAHRLLDVYGKGRTGPFDGNLFVLCDTYIRKRPSGVKTGMPILYYRADPNGMTHDVDDPDNPANIYDKRFYTNTQSDKIVTQAKPYNTDSFIFISAGYDGLYGTADDICNFDWKYRE